jgi:parallel beta-helix repeat protein
VHFLPGVHHFTFEDSEILGGYLGITIHLSADGGWNVIKNNKITGQRKTGGWPGTYIGKRREVISIDSSEHNRIVNNHISDMTYGGIALYRNCGERGSIRHRIPQYNQIINNVFDYSVGGQSKPTIFIGSRDDKSIKWSLGGVKRYCHDDEGKNGERFRGNDVPEPWDTETVRNSSESNSDWAQNNVIADNQLIKFSPVFLTPFPGIRLSSKAKNLDNYLIGNESVSTRSLNDALDIQRTRGAGCAVLAGTTNEMQAPYEDPIKNGNVPYIRNTETVKYFWDIRPVVQLACNTPLVCQNNILERSEGITCEEPIIHDFGSEAQACNAENNVCAEASNAGDSHDLNCPGGNLIGIQAACNLEFGKATDAQRERVLLNRVKVVRASDDKDDGRCTADGRKIKDGQRLISPWLFKRYDDEIIPNEIKYKCAEHDSNGGDCHVNVRHYCEPFGPTGPIL